jgi:hypothetical protein
MVSAVNIASSVFSSCRDTMGVPQTLWREIHHSVRSRMNDDIRVRASGNINILHDQYIRYGIAQRELTIFRVELDTLEGFECPGFDVPNIGKPLGCRATVYNRMRPIGLSEERSTHRTIMGWLVLES